MYGHKEVKKSLLQLIGKWISNPTSSGGSIALVGPPGVGKTLLAKCWISLRYTFCSNYSRWSK